MMNSPRGMPIRRTLAAGLLAALATGGLADVALPDGDKAGQTVKTTLLPMTLAGERLPVRLQPPPLAAHTEELLLGLGYARGEIDDFKHRAVVA